MEEAVDGCEQWLVENGRGNAGSGTSLKGSLKVGANHDGVRMELKTGSGLVDDAVDTATMEAELNVGKAVRQWAATLEEVMSN